VARPSKPLAGLALAASAGGVVAMVSTTIGQEQDYLHCLETTLILEILLFMSFVACLLFCNEERRCEVRCITIFIVLQLVIMFFLLMCVLRAGGVF
jgi:hypothetical protein